MVDGIESGRRPLLLAAGILAAGAVLTALVFGAFFFNARAPQQTVRVVGSASQGFEADIVKWRLTLSRQVSDAAIRSGYAELRDDVAHFRSVLRARGLPDSAVIAQPPTAQPMWGREGVRTGYTLQQPMYVISERLADVEPLALDPVGVIREGAALEMSQLEYFAPTSPASSTSCSRRLPGTPGCAPPRSPRRAVPVSAASSPPAPACSRSPSRSPPR